MRIDGQVFSVSGYRLALLLIDAVGVTQHNADEREVLLSYMYKCVISVIPR
jgi:hypothetical protein